MQDERKTKAQLLEELRQHREAGARIAALAEEHERTCRALRERVKELDCLYGISRLAQNRDLSLEQVIRRVGELVCASWQYPEIACSRIRAGALDIATANYRPSPWAQSSPVFIQEERIGDIEVRYLEERPASDEGPFLREERSLIDAVADKLGRLVQVNRAEARMRMLSRELIRAQENERLRIATELHDHLAQDLASLKLELGALLEPLPDSGPVLHERVVGMADRLSGAITAIRDLAYGLLPPGLGDLGLVRTLARYCTDFSSRNSIPVDFFADGMDGVRLDFETQIHIYRMVQEALTNTRKHAQATRATVRIIRSHPSVILRMEDDGQGVDLEQRMEEFFQAKKMGLWGMRERARLLGGSITLRSRPGRGMRILVELPVEKKANDA